MLLHINLTARHLKLGHISVLQLFYARKSFVKIEILQIFKCLLVKFLYIFILKCHNRIKKTPNREDISKR